MWQAAGWRAASAEVGVEPQFNLLVEGVPALENVVGMVATASPGTVPVALPFPGQWLRLIGGQLVAQPGVTQQVITAQLGGVFRAAPEPTAAAQATTPKPTAAVEDAVAQALAV